MICMQDANLWDVATAPTIVMTQRGARQAFQDVLRGRGVEVVQFDFLTPDAVAAYCFDRGFLQVLWECGGTLAAPAISCRVIHKALAFVAPKLVRRSLLALIKRGLRIARHCDGRAVHSATPAATAILDLTCCPCYSSNTNGER